MMSFAFGSLCSALFMCATVLHCIWGVFALPYWMFALGYIALIGCIIGVSVSKKANYLVGFSGFQCVFWAFGDLIMLLLSGALPSENSVPPIVEWDHTASIVWLVVLLLLSVCTFPFAHKCASLFKRNKENPDPKKQYANGQMAATGGIVGGMLFAGMLAFADTFLEPAQFSVISCFVLLGLMFLFQMASIAFLAYHKFCNKTFFNRNG